MKLFPLIYSINSEFVNIFWDREYLLFEFWIWAFETVWKIIGYLKRARDPPIIPSYTTYGYSYPFNYSQQLSHFSFSPSHRSNTWRWSLRSRGPEVQAPPNGATAFFHQSSPTPPHYNRLPCHRAKPPTAWNLVFGELHLYLPWLHPESDVVLSLVHYVRNTQPGCTRMKNGDA
jgi:hypothetical protein